MKSLLTFLPILLVSIFFVESPALAWGERGHNTVGYTAARFFHHWLQETEKEQVGNAFDVRDYQMGHLSNIPDISWKAVKVDTIKKLNYVNHFFDPEVLLGLPASDNAKDAAAFQKQIRELPLTWKEVEKTYAGKPNTFKKGHPPVQPYFDSGSAPWRAADLYDKMVFFFQCAKQKENAKDTRFHKELFPLQGNRIVRHVTCGKSATRDEALLAAYVAGGLMGHFVGDLAQPLHATADFDGWSKGLGGIHAYYESELVHVMKDDLNEAVLAHARDQKFQREVKKRIGGDWNAPVVKIMLNLAADSWGRRHDIEKLDQRYAVLELGDKLPRGYGADDTKGAKPAKRRPVTQKVAAHFRDITVDRIATAATILSHFWYAAWKQAGSPKLADVSRIATPYPLDAAFLMPDYAPGLSSKGSSSK